MKTRNALSAAALLAVLAGGTFVTSSTADDGNKKLLARERPVHAPMFRAAFDDEPAEAFAASNTELLAWLPLNSFPNDNAAGNDCWGYVSPSGREYAIMGLEKGFGFVEITQPDAPVIVGYVEGPSSVWHDIKVVGHYAYGVSEGGAGVQVVDLSNIDNGEVRHVKNKSQAGHSTTHNIAANTDSGYLYLCGANFANGGLVALSIEDPENPTIVGAWSDMYVHDAQIVSYTEGKFAGREIAFCASGFGNGSGDTGLRIVDVTDKNNMHTISTGFWENDQYSHQCWLTEDKQYLYVNDELDEEAYGYTTRTRVFDVSDVENPVFVGNFSSGVDAIDHNLYVRDGLVFEANYRSGLRVFDASNPAEPTQIAYFDSYPSNDKAQFNGAWSVYPFFPSGTVIVSDIERGLFVLKVDALSDAKAVAVSSIAK
ncbi:MAG: choice-of-anchor B family protein [Phycisphaeraceae bacterium]|nr:choice-of-anchor B family protein [Phycisphaerales bacterium]MCB9860508.1 choice-of-anchor B family protein [Phycisphaeraceae bacterium]